MKLNLGCGKKILDNYINIDWISSPGVNMILDLSTDKLPFNNESIDEIIADDILEHIWNWENLIEECIRVLKINGILKIHVPYRMTDLNTYHKRFFDETTFDGFLTEADDFTSNTATSLEGNPTFKRISRTYNRKPLYPLGWTFKKYLGVPYILSKKVAMKEIFQKVMKRNAFK